MKIKVFTILLLIFSLLISNVNWSQKDSIVYWKRYTSIDFVSFGLSFNDHKLSQNRLYNIGLFTFNFGLLKREKTPFLNIGLDGADDFKLLVSDGYGDISIRLGWFIIKKAKLECTVSSGYGWLGISNNTSRINSLSSNLRIIYKPLKWLGLGTSYYINVNEFQNFQGLRFCLNFSNGL